ncbi:MAG: hypothetical protein K6F53_11185 [Lachnospiraceae bacterium]|nr:hypothetical protein [Lachnospiraceae bacterium]
MVSVTLSNGTVLTPEDFRVDYGNNIAAKKDGGSFKIVLKRNSGTGSFAFGGSATFKFTITKAGKITM